MKGLTSTTLHIGVVRATGWGKTMTGRADRLTPEEYKGTLEEYKVVRDKWVHEDNLTNHRLSWLLDSQALLFAAYGVFIAAPPQSAYSSKAQILVILIPILGAVVTLLAGISIVAAT